MGNQCGTTGKIPRDHWALAEARSSKMDTVAFDHLSDVTGVDMYSKEVEQRDTQRRSLGGDSGSFSAFRVIEGRKAAMICRQELS